MNTKRSYHRPVLSALDRRTPSTANVQGSAAVQEHSSGSIDHTKLCHQLLHHLLNCAAEENWHRHRGKWARLVNNGPAEGQRQYLPDYLVPLADVIETCV